MNKIITILLMALAVNANAKHHHKVYTPAPPAEEVTMLVYNISTQQATVSANADKIRPMASITKLMTAMISLDLYRLDEAITVGRHQTVTVEQLLTRLLIRSDNGAAELLARHHPEGRDAFLTAMNERAQRLGLVNTEYHDPSGLIRTNTTTANDLAKLIATAGTYSFIKATASQAEVVQDASKKHPVVLNNTNHTILKEFHNILVSKTGYTTPAGRCLALLVDSSGQQYAIIILGENTPQNRDRLARVLIQSTNNS